MAWEIQQIMKDREIDVCGIWGQSDLYDFSCVCDEIVNKLHSLYDFPEKTPNDYIFRVIFSVFLKKKSWIYSKKPLFYRFQAIAIGFLSLEIFLIL